MMNVEKKSALLEFVKSIVVSFIFVTILTQWVIKPIQVNQSSMYPTLKDQQLGFSNILSYQVFGIKRFDVVIVYAPQIDDYLVKRVIALEGETVEYRDDQLYINDVLIEEHFIDQVYFDQQKSIYGMFSRDFGPYTISQGEVFLVGDNRPYSSDSRDYGSFQVSDILCKDVIIFYPFKDIAWVKGD